MLFRNVYLATIANTLIVGAAFGNDCQRLSDATKVEIVGGLQQTVRTGDTVKFRLHVQITDAAVLDLVPEFSPLTFQIYFTNGINGSEMLFAYARPRRTELLNGVEVERSVVVPENLMGRYTGIIGYYMLALPDGDRYCVPNLTHPQYFIDVVPLNPARTDVFPPIVTSLNLSSDHLRIGETLRIELQAFDSSGVCTIELRQANKCVSGNWHIEFVDSTGSSLHVFADNHFDQERNVYFVDVPIAATTENGAPQFLHGSYKVFVHDVYDLWRNNVHQLPDVFTRTIQIE